MARLDREEKKQDCKGGLAAVLLLQLNYCRGFTGIVVELIPLEVA